MPGERLGDLGTRRRRGRAGQRQPPRGHRQRALGRPQRTGATRCSSSPPKAKLVGNYTPTNTGGAEHRRPRPRLDLARLPHVEAHRAGRQGREDPAPLARAAARARRPHKGHELQIVSTPSGTDLFTAPAVWRERQARLADRRRRRRDRRRGRCAAAASTRSGATARAARARSIAGGLLYVYDPSGGLDVYQPGEREARHDAACRRRPLEQPDRDRRPRRAAGGQRERPRHERRARHLALKASRAPAADLRRLLAERGVGERLQRLVQRRELAREAEEVLVVVEPLVRLRELVARCGRAARGSGRSAGRRGRAPSAHRSAASSSRDRTTTVSAPSAASHLGERPDDLHLPRGARMRERDLGQLARRVAEDADPRARRRRAAAARRSCRGGDGSRAAPRSAANRASSGRQSPSASSSTRRRGLAILGHVELDARPPGRILEPRVPQRPRVGEHAVEVERDADSSHDRRC